MVLTLVCKHVTVDSPYKNSVYKNMTSRPEVKIILRYRDILMSIKGKG